MIHILGTEVSIFIKRVPKIFKRVGKQKNIEMKESANPDLITGVIFLFCMCFLIFVIGVHVLSARAERSEEDNKIIGDNDQATYYHFFTGSDWSFFRPSFGLMKIERTKKKVFFGLFNSYEEKTLWEIGPLRSEYGFPYISKNLLKVALDRYGETVEETF